jgi:EAL and modified HD-GYP domain-containing signal transduction protein
VHVGRQALFDRTNTVVGYELLFRGDAHAVEAAERGAYATSRVLVTAFTDVGIHSLVGGALCFVNLTREFIVGELPLPFGPEQVVLEVLETIEVDDEVVAGVTRLVEEGYAIALDDFVIGGAGGTGHERLLDLATYVKLDVLGTDPAELAATVAACRRYPEIRLVAERLETPEQLDRASALGFDLFQGYVLSRPQVVPALALSPSRLRRIELLGLLVGPDIPLAQVVRLVTGDPALAIRLLAVANADPLGLPVEVSSVHEAVALLGVGRLRDWATLMLLSDLDEGNPEPLAAAVTRARMCQNLAGRMDLPPEAAFTVGLISAAAELIGQSPADLAPRLSLTHDVSDALVLGEGPLGELLNLVHAYEASDLPMLVAAPVPSPDTTRAYLDAVAWSSRFLDRRGEM